MKQQSQESVTTAPLPLKLYQTHAGKPEFGLHDCLLYGIYSMMVHIKHIANKNRNTNGKLSRPLLLCLSFFLPFSFSPSLPSILPLFLFMWAIQNPGIHVKFQMVSAKQINSSHHTKASRRPDTGLNEKYNINCFMSPSSFNLFSLL